LVASALLPITGMAVLGVAHLKREPVGPWEKTLQVSDQWAETGLQAQKDRCYRLTAQGELKDGNGGTFSPEGSAPEVLRSSLGPPKGITDEECREMFVGQHPVRALIARIGDKSWTIHVGADLTFIAPASGEMAVKLACFAGETQSCGGTLELRLAEVREPRFVNPDGSSSIAARIDDVDYLLITPEGLQWEYGGNWARVGMHQGIYPTLVNGIAWWPDWTDPMTSSVLKTRAFAEGVKSGSLSLGGIRGEFAQAAITRSDNKAFQVRVEDMGLGSSTVGFRLSQAESVKP
jgi:hypothetical protein